ncbi:MAG: YebC/PmpR family DNA-binding transcriptional regulator [Bifidobacteriaceae bacterium]|jgi:YebC/PmpR family DNA-binding regulatory protein|nr:YebC/PmpR family DNA-binding transcriptional regulator [Bifidobacteriaceae bacterium]
MSGHSKWATTKHKKAANDAKRSKLWAKLIKNIEVAAKLGGGDLAGNPSLYEAVQKAKKNSVPKDNIDRAVKRGSGEGSESVNYETLIYEAYGQGSVGILVECLTDNRNRAVGEVKVAVTKNGGQMATEGSVSFQFTRKGVIMVPVETEIDDPNKKGKTITKTVTEDEVFEVALEAGAEDVSLAGDEIEVVVEPNDLITVRKAIQDAGIEYNSAEVVFYPSTKVPVDEATAEKVLNIIDNLEDLDDVQNIYTNME